MKTNMFKENTMKFKSKIAIAFAAFVITMLGFGLMISPAVVELANAGQEVNLEITYDNTGRTDATLHYFFFIFG